MKQLAVLALIIFVYGCKKEEPAGNVHITGNVEGLKKGTIVIRNDENTKTIDSIVINGNSQFESHFTLESPQMLHLYLNRGVSNSIDNSLGVFAEPGNIVINTTLDRFYADAKVTGSKNHDLYQEFRKGNQRYNEQKLELTKQRFEAFKNKVAFDEAAAIEQTNKIESRRYLYVINFAINHKDRDVAPFIALSEVRAANIQLLDTVMKSLAPEVSRGKYGRMLSTFIEQRRAAETTPAAASK